MDELLMNPMMTDTLQNLYAGHIDGFDREVLAFSPLPSDIIDPYISQNVDAMETMRITHNTLCTWIEESHKASYFTKHFVQLSRMIMNGVATMGRGLVTLHQNGEPLEKAPMSIGDLISAASYQFRKSHLGVFQTMRSHPEISERLLINQLGWSNTLMKLFKTREKLAKKPQIINRVPQIAAEDCPQGAAGAALPNAEAGSGNGCLTDPGAFNPFSEIREQGISELSAISEPQSYGAIRAFRALSGSSSQISGKGKGRKALSTRTDGSEAEQKNLLLSDAQDHKSEIRKEAEKQEEAIRTEASRTDAADSGNEEITNSREQQQASEDENIRETENSGVEKEFRIQDPGISDPDFHISLADPDSGPENENNEPEMTEKPEAEDGSSNEQNMRDPVKTVCSAGTEKELSDAPDTRNRNTDNSLFRGPP